MDNAIGAAQELDGDAHLGKGTASATAQGTATNGGIAKPSRTGLNVHTS
jgi:hypothetical protein